MHTPAVVSLPPLLTSSKRGGNLRACGERTIQRYVRIDLSSQSTPARKAGDALAPLPPLLHVAESALTVGAIATREMESLLPSSDTRSARRRMEELGLDVMPLAESPIRRYVDVADLDSDHRPITEAANVIDARHLVTAGLGLADGVMSFRDQRFFFVLEGRELAGIVTWSDLQKPPVSMVVFALILAAEAALDRLIVQYHGRDWPELLSGGRREKAVEVLEDRRRRNIDIDLIQSLMLEDRLTLLRKTPELREELGFAAANDVRAWGKNVLPLRNVLAHGGDLLRAEPDVERAVDLFARVRAFAERAWSRVSVR